MITLHFRVYLEFDLSRSFNYLYSFTAMIYWSTEVKLTPKCVTFICVLPLRIDTWYLRLKYILFFEYLINTWCIYLRIDTSILQWVLKILKMHLLVSLFFINPFGRALHSDANILLHHVSLVHSNAIPCELEPSWFSLHFDLNRANEVMTLYEEMSEKMLSFSSKREQRAHQTKICRWRLSILLRSQASHKSQSFHFIELLAAHKSKAI